MNLTAGRLRTLTLLSATLGLSLSACAYFDVPGSTEETERREVIDLNSGRVLDGVQREEISEFPENDPVSPQRVQPHDLNYPPIDVIPRPQPNSSIEVYSLDGPAQGVYSPSRQSPALNRNGNTGIRLTPPSQFDEESSITPLYTPPENITKPKLSAVPVGDVAATVLFDHNSTDVKSDDVKTLSAMAQNLSSGNEPPVSIEGHASKSADVQDPIQRQLVNLKVSMQRAFNVAKVLMQNGVPAERVELKAYGEGQPASTAEQSRRVDIKSSSDS